MAEDYTKQIHRCFNCGYCKFDSNYTDFNCPSYVRFRFDTYSTSGRLWLINAWLRGEVQWDEHLGEILYTCVTCRNCAEQCIMRFSNDIVDWIIAARRDMMEKEQGKIPERVGSFLEEIYRIGNPLKARVPRGEWADGVPGYRKGTEYLLYVGCLGSFDGKAREMAKSVATLLELARVSFGVLGDDEGCCGNEVHTLGEQTLFELLAGRNIKQFQELGVRKVVAMSPHAYHAMKNLYPPLGADFEVLHYTQLLQHLVRDGHLKTRETQQKKVAYHDPCYLGRYNGVYDAPRQVLRGVPGLELVAMPRERENAFCCGGGSGNFAMDLLEGSGESPGRVRVREAYESGAEVLAVACPSCLTMLTSAVESEGLDDKLIVRDIAQIVRQSLVT